jgi:hypothetical protein
MEVPVPPVSQAENYGLTMLAEKNHGFMQGRTSDRVR